MVAGILPPSQLLRKFAAYPRQHDLAVALREIGRVERRLFILEWLLDAYLQRRAQIGLNKGEAHHALKSALRIGHQGEIRDRTAEGQHYRMAGLNLLAAIIIYWNTAHLGRAVAKRQTPGLPRQQIPVRVMRFLRRRSSLALGARIIARRSRRVVPEASTSVRPRRPLRREWPLRETQPRPRRGNRGCPTPTSGW